MRYLGGKARQSRDVLDVILAQRGDRSRYVEPFMGGGSVLSRVAPHFDLVTGGDAVPELVELWRAVTNGWDPPAEMTREAWTALRDDPSPTAAKGWAAYAASYNGKYFAGYGPTAPGAGRDYLAESRRGILRKAATLGHARFVCCDYADHDVDADTVVYCDPPYEGTEQYGAVGDFDHGRFWDTMGEWTARGALVLVHEYAAPEGWVVVHERARTETMNHGGKSSGARMERLFGLRALPGTAA